MSDEPEQVGVVVPDVTMKDLLDAIPAHCFKRSAVKSSMYLVWHLSIIATIYKTTTYLDTLISPAIFNAPHPFVYSLVRFALWSLYGFWAGLFGTGIWVIGHEAGHQAYSESKLINNTIGWILHSALGVPYHSWRITHAKHHASTGHMTQDQVWVPKTRSQRGLRPFDPKREDRLGARASLEVQKELQEAIGDSPIGAAWQVAMYVLLGWPMYIIRNKSGQRRYPAYVTNHFNPKAVMFSPHHYRDIIVSDVGVVLWLAGIIYASLQYSFATVFTVYLVPYLWINHWLVLITFLQHTDPLLPHYRAPQFNFQRGALATLDRSLLGDLGSVAAWIGAHATCGISETHVTHHICSKIPHYNAWEATDALREKVLRPAGVRWEGAAGGWAEMYRVFRECRFVEDEGDVVFYKNARGLAKARPVFNDLGASDSGIEIFDGKN
ncbi:FA-desaturase domain-containing protein [Mycena indigotica]|uniref:FA-desaturase domain-containing protein n=1 Tax=Mycena indigotica TaxID=2126181 RepID=A0A8H6SLS8_9AGAR|nr:FA-desaturase domain-containing protein [Mycena indigotica]KAF7302105.1 FA-desaturase domain-containing protein [Mycena indigotica]